METAEHELYTASPWSPERRPSYIARLGKMMEELGELVSAAARCLIQGLDKGHPVTGKPNREWIEEEIGDVLAQIDHFADHNRLSWDNIQARRHAKYRFTKGWYDLVDAGLIAHDSRVEDLYVTTELYGRLSLEALASASGYCILVGLSEEHGWQLQLANTDRTWIIKELRIDLNGYTIWDNLHKIKEGTNDQIDSART